MKLFEFNNIAAPTPQAQPVSAPPTQDPKAKAGAAAISRALGGKVDTKFAQAIDKAEQGKALPPALLKSIAPFAGALEKIFADPAMRTKFLAMVKSVQAQESITEDHDSVDAVAGAITRRIMSQHLDLLSKYGPVKVMAAIDDVADFAGSDGLDEIGSSDVSIWTKQVIQDLESGHFDHMESAEKIDEILPAIGAAVGRAVVGSGASAVTRSVAGGIGHVAGTMAQSALGDNDEDPTDANSKDDDVDTVTLDVPLLLRMMEYAREDAQEDMDLHNAAERMIAMAKDGPLSMDDYESIVGNVEALPAPDQDPVKEGFYSVRSKQLKQELENNGWERIPAQEVPDHAKYGYRKNGVGRFYKVIDEPYHSFDVSFVKPRRVIDKLVPLDTLLQLIRGSSVTDDKKTVQEAENKQYIEITHQSGNKKRVPVHPLNAKRALDRYRNDPSTKSARFVDEEINKAYDMWKVEFPKQHAGKYVDAGTIYVKARNTVHAHKVAAKRAGVDSSVFKTTVTKSSILPENYYTPGPETMPGAVGPQENTTVSFNQSKTVGDATLNISASAKDMEELHRILKLAGIDYNAAGEERPTMKDVAAALAPHMPEEPAEEPCGCDDAEVAIPMVSGPKPLDLKYTTDKTALINAIKDKLAQRLS